MSEVTSWPEPPPRIDKRKPRGPYSKTRDKLPPPTLGELVDQPLRDDKGRTVEMTLPIQPANQQIYNRQLESTHMGFNEFLKCKSFESLKLALSRDGSHKATKFLKALIHPKNINVDIATLAERNGITFTDLLAVWRNDKLVEAMLTIFDAAPTIAAHTVKDAESTLLCCPRCDGAGMMKINREELFTWVTCVACDGNGSIRKTGDKQSRQFVYECVGIVKNRAVVQFNNHISLSSAVESVLEEMDAINITASLPEPE